MSASHTKREELLRRKIELTEKARQLHRIANPPHAAVPSKNSSKAIDAEQREEAKVLDQIAIRLFEEDMTANEKITKGKKEKSAQDHKTSTSKSSSSFRTVRDSNIRTKEGNFQKGLYNLSEIISKFVTSSPNPDFKSASAYVRAARPDRLSELFQTSLNKEREARVQRLLQHVVRGEQNEAEAMLKNNPSLLLYKGRVTDYSGRVIEGTALQLAISAEDVAFHKGEECMVEMIQKNLRRLPEGEVEIAKQISQQFPEGYEKSDIKKQEQDLNALNAMIKAIGDSRATTADALQKDCEPALEQFRNYLKPTGVITSGKHFNVQMLVRAFELYDEKFDDFGGRWDSPKNMLFWQKVIGYIQRFLPACYAQAFAQGIYYIVEERENLRRTFDFRIGGGSYFPLDSDPRFRLGYDWAGGRGWGVGPGAARADSRIPFKTYVEQKQQRCRIMQSRPDNQSKSVCVVM